MGDPESQKVSMNTQFLSLASDVNQGWTFCNKIKENHVVVQFWVFWGKCLGYASETGCHFACS